MTGDFTATIGQWKDVGHHLWPKPFHTALCGHFENNMRIHDNLQRQCGMEPSDAPARPARAHHRCRSFATIIGVCHAAGTQLLGPLLWLLKHSALTPSPDLSGYAMAHPGQHPPYDPAHVFTSAEIELVFADLAKFMLASRQARLPNPHKHASRAMHWNLTSLHKLDTCKAQAKLRVLAGHLTKGPVFLGETKWDASTAMRTSLRLSGHRVFDTPAVPKGTNDRPSASRADHAEMPTELSGGVAAIFPTDIYPQRMEATTIVPGYALHIQQNVQGGPTHWVVVYLPPGREKELLKLISTYLAKHVKHGRLYLCGDLNKAPALSHEWEAFLATHHLTDVTGKIPTYHCLGKKKKSTLDRWLVRDYAIDQGRLATLVHASHLSGDCDEHARVTIRFKPILSSIGAHPSFQAIPPAALVPALPAAQDLARTLRAAPTLDTAQRQLDQLAALAWTWWRNMPRDIYKTIARSEHLLRRAARTTGPTALVPRQGLLAILSRIHHQVNLRDFPAASNGDLIVPTSVLRTLLDAHNVGEMQRSVFHSAPQEVQQAAGTTKASPAIWKRLKKLEPKAAGSLTHLRTSNGTIITDPILVEKEVRSTRGFWTEPPPALDPQLLAALPAYAEGSASMASLEPPDMAEYLASIHRTADSAPGTDGLPYALLRLVPDIAAALLDRFLLDLTTDPNLVRMPEPLLVWIPKALEGLSPDNWRPLGLPTTFLRVLSAAIYNKMQAKIVGLLHPSQALLNDFREPQGNFMDAHKALRQRHDSKAPLTTVALTDYMKAFEIVNPQWILAVLQARRAPLWLLAYARFVLNGRKVYPKIQGKLLHAIFVVVGVDMGSAISPLFFCLAMDPLLVALNRIPRVLGVRAYMDDNQIWGTDLAWLRQFQHRSDELRTAGLIINQHQCCLLTPVGRNAGLVTTLVATSSWKRAAVEALSAAPSALTFCPLGTTVRLSRLAVRRMLHGENGELLAQLVALPCSCKTKTSYLTNRQLTLAEVAEFDDLPWGAKPLTASTTVLGLTLASRASFLLPLAPRYRATMANAPRYAGRRLRHITKESEDKILVKAKGRATSLRRALTPLPQRAAAHGGWIQALSYYTSSVFAKSAKHWQQLRVNHAALVLDGHWLQALHLQEILSYVKISTTAPYRRAADMAAVGLALRRVGGTAVILGHNGLPEEVQHRVVHIMLQWQQALPLASWDRIKHVLLDVPPGNSKAAAKAGNLCKQVLSEVEHTLASQELETAHRRVRWTTFSMTRAWQTMHSIPLKDLSAVARVATLRMTLNREADDRYRWHNTDHQGHHGPCFWCTEPTTHYPYGRRFAGTCLAHSEVDYWWLHSAHPSLVEVMQGYLSVAPPVPRRLPRMQCIHLLCPPCALCGHGDNTVEHVLLYCPVAIAILSCLSGRLTSPRNWFQGGRVDILLHAHILHGLRREMLSRNAFSHGVYGHPVMSPPSDQGRLAAALLRDICAGLPAPLHALREGLSPGATIEGTSCPHCTCAVLGAHSDPLEPSVRRSASNGRPRLTLFSAKQVLPNGLLLRTHQLSFLRVGAMVEHGWLPPPENALLHQCNAAAHQLTCACGQEVLEIRAATVLAPGEALVVHSPSPFLGKGRHLIVQFDGSCKRPTSVRPAAGAGAVFWMLTPAGFELLLQKSLPLPAADDSQQAEALAAALCITTIAEHLAEWAPDTIEIQGDNQAIIGVWNGTCRFHGAKLNEMIDHARTVALYQLPHLQWTYLPRERNIVADELAGKASAWLESVIGVFDTESLPPHLIPHTIPKGRFCRETHPNPIQLIADLGQPQAVPIQCWERFPLIDWECVALLIQQKPSNNKGLRRLYHAIGHQTSAQHLVVSYFDRSQGDLCYGRRYPDGPSLCALTKDMRLALVGHTHWELDVEGCHYAIFVDFLRRYCPGFAIPTAYSSVALVRQEMEDIFAPTLYGFPRPSPYAKARPDFKKKIPTVALNWDRKPMGDYMAHFYRLAGGIPARYDTFLAWIEAAKAALWGSAAPRPTDPRIKASNQVYFMLENVEEQFLSGVVKLVLEHHHMDSLLWLHDGIWFAPPAPARLVDAAIQAIKIAMHLPTVRVKYSSLAEPRQALLRKLPLPASLSAGNKLKLQLYHEQGPCKKNGMGPISPLASVLQQIQAGHQPKRKYDPTQPTLKAFLERKAKRLKVPEVLA